MRIWILNCQLRQMQLTPMIKCQLSDTWDSNWHVLVTKQCQLNLNFARNTGRKTMDIFDYQTANAGLHQLLPSLRRWKPQVFIWKYNKSISSKMLKFLPQNSHVCVQNTQACSKHRNKYNKITSHVLKPKQAGALKRTKL